MVFVTHLCESLWLLNVGGDRWGELSLPEDVLPQEFRLLLNGFLFDGDGPWAVVAATAAQIEGNSGAVIDEV